MIRIDIPTEDFAIFESVCYGGAAIFSLTPCTEDAADIWDDLHRQAIGMRVGGATAGTTLPAAGAGGEAIPATGNAPRPITA